MEAQFIYQDEKSNKFWNIETNGKSFTVTYGKTGTAGQSQTKEFDTEEKCLKEAEKLVKEKQHKGYVENTAPSSILIATGGEKKKPVKSDARENYMDIQKIEEHFHVILPERLKNFITNLEYQKFNEKLLAQPPTVEKDPQTFTVDFTTPKLFKAFEANDKNFKSEIDPLELLDIDCVDDSNEPVSAVPLCSLGKEDFVAVRIDRPSCPVLFFEPDENMFYDHASSLDDFLSLLYDKNDIPTLHKAADSVRTAITLFENRKFQEALDCISDKVVIAVRNTGWFGEIASLKVKCYMELGKWKEAEKYMTDDDDDKLELYFKLNRLEEVAAWLKRTRDNNPKTADLNFELLLQECRLAVLVGDSAKAESSCRFFLLRFQSSFKTYKSYLKEQTYLLHKSGAVKDMFDLHVKIAKIVQNIIDIIQSIPDRQPLCKKILGMIESGMQEFENNIEFHHYDAIGHVYHSVYPIETCQKFLELIKKQDAALQAGMIAAFKTDLEELAKDKAAGKTTKSNIKVIQKWFN